MKTAFFLILLLFPIHETYANPCGSIFQRVFQRAKHIVRTSKGPQTIDEWNTLKLSAHKQVDILLEKVNYQAQAMNWTREQILERFGQAGLAQIYGVIDGHYSMQILGRDPLYLMHFKWSLESHFNRAKAYLDYVNGLLVEQRYGRNAIELEINNMGRSHFPFLSSKRNYHLKMEILESRLDEIDSRISKLAMDANAAEVELNRLRNLVEGAKTSSAMKTAEIFWEGDTALMRPRQ